MLVYTHAQGRDIPETLDKVQEKLEAGYRAIRVQSGIPGMGQIYGVAKAEGSYEPAIRGKRPAEERWDTSKYLQFVPQLFARVREQFGEAPLLLHDAHHRLTPIEAARLGRELEPFHLFWLEDAVPAELQEGFRLIRQHTRTPLAVGEVFNSIHDAHLLITEQLIDYIRMTASHSGGITPMLKVAQLAALYHVQTGCHGPSDISPIGLAACLHVGKAINNFGIQEYMGYAPETEEAFPYAYYYRDGHIWLTETPGLGVEYNEDFARKFPYQRAYLPVNRKDDGTLFHW
jgi:mannonate dehydratase